MFAQNWGTAAIVSALVGATSIGGCAYCVGKTKKLHHILKTEKLSWTENSYLKPFLGETSVVVRLRAFPLSPVLLKLMLPKQMIDSETTSLILLVSDWMALSLEIDSRYNIWRQITRRKQTRFGFQRGQYN